MEQFKTQELSWKYVFSWQEVQFRAVMSQVRHELSQVEQVELKKNVPFEHEVQISAEFSHVWQGKLHCLQE